MATLEELKQNKTGNTTPTEQHEFKTLSKEDLQKIIPKKDTPSNQDQFNNFINDELSVLDNIMAEEDKKVKEQEEAREKEAEEIMDIAVFDVELDDLEKGTITQEEAQEQLNKSFEDFSQGINEVKEDPSVQAGINAVNSVPTEVNPENMEIDDLLKDLDDEDDLDDDLDDEDEIRDGDLDDEDDDLDDEAEKQMLKDMQEQVGQVIKPFNNIVDLKSFSIATRPKSAKKVLEEVTEGQTATWVLLDSQKPFTCTALGAVEINNLDPNNTNTDNQNGRIDALKQMYGTLFRHYVSPNKPATLEEWLKVISFADQDNLIFGYYKATYGNSNFITYACDNCKEVKVEQVPIDDCVKYTDDKTKEEVENILRYGDPTHNGEIKSKLIQVSDTLAISIKNPSIYNMIFEFGVLDAAFTEKYADTLGVIAYIEDIYEIDVANQTLVRIAVKEDSKNLTKSVKRKFRAKLEILKKLTPDQYQVLLAEITNVSRNADRISYRQPKYTCKKCGHKFDEIVMTAQNLLFTRHQLALIPTLSIE